MLTLKKTPYDGYAIVDENDEEVGSLYREYLYENAGRNLILHGETEPVQTVGADGCKNVWLLELNDTVKYFRKFNDAKAFISAS
jgi:hypothetical protein